MVRMVVITCVFVILASGCSKEYVYTAPQTEAGTICVAKCQERQSTCRDKVAYDAEMAKKQCEKTSAEEFKQCEIKAEDDFELCEKSAEFDYYGCLKYSPNRASCIKTDCVKSSCYKKSCYRHVNYSYCDGEFRGCYQQCGGKVEEVK